MLSTFFYSVALLIKLCSEMIFRQSEAGTQSFGQIALRLLLIAIALPIWLVNWFFLLLDEVFFPSYHAQKILSPVFILGVPRSGTTYLHRTMAQDEGSFTAVKTWEVFFAPSIIQRYFWLGLAKVDNGIGSPFGKLLSLIERKLFSSMDGVHELALAEAEEDYLLLIPILSCFILFLPFTESTYIWQLSRFDWDMPPNNKRRIMAFYKACIKKHLFVHGKGRRYLSKNAAFGSWSNSLQQEFPDARFVICMREPERAIPSLLGSLEAGAKLFRLDLCNGSLAPKLISMMQDAYRHLLVESDLQAPIVPMKALKTDLVATLSMIYDYLGLGLSKEYSECLAAIKVAGDHYRSTTKAVTPSSLEKDSSYLEKFPWYYPSPMANPIANTASNAYGGSRDSA